VKPDNMKKLVDGVKLTLNKISPKRRRDRISDNTQKRGNFGGGGGPRESYGDENNYSMERDSGRRKLDNYYDNFQQVLAITQLPSLVTFCLNVQNFNIYIMTKDIIGITILPFGNSVPRICTFEAQKIKHE
jgi:hypothetical protein